MSDSTNDNRKKPDLLALLAKLDNMPSEELEALPEEQIEALLLMTGMGHTDISESITLLEQMPIIDLGTNQNTN